jgi:hypothetical protein
MYILIINKDKTKESSDQSKLIARGLSLYWGQRGKACYSSSLYESASACATACLSLAREPLDHECFYDLTCELKTFFKKTMGDKYFLEKWKSQRALVEDNWNKNQIEMTSILEDADPEDEQFFLNEQTIVLEVKDFMFTLRTPNSTEDEEVHCGQNIDLEELYSLIVNFYKNLVTKAFTKAFAKEVT